ncbi:hypothetical protein, unlikely [Trypanosoma brucei gambiense DAL972]|uniref:Uncharacterized protein n=1 Tax=Trypanosoma brucei gambiense (strain MHOM/CI/86/DAL972) TaxID=679716 RepID=C9ZT14_TRYB9|nr:hypothetical protein, unlikely [Trypanosoma brucei gambiense DAL972]CBH12549.1 hypothetical protein, unlikely [Trypanosoma brucei gambiense DAL972]|eukprot:XP_011774829.1 hypothetical protein, unlikely [Trypanosoma brucei gambiense DAL972]
MGSLVEDGEEHARVSAHVLMCFDNVEGKKKKRKMRRVMGGVRRRHDLWRVPALGSISCIGFISFSLFLFIKKCTRTQSHAQLFASVACYSPTILFFLCVFCSCNFHLPLLSL